MDTADALAKLRNPRAEPRGTSRCGSVREGPAGRGLQSCWPRPGDTGSQRTRVRAAKQRRGVLRGHRSSRTHQAGRETARSGEGHRVGPRRPQRSAGTQHTAPWMGSRDRALQAGRREEGLCPPRAHGSRCGRSTQELQGTRGGRGLGGKDQSRRGRRQLAGLRGLMACCGGCHCTAAPGKGTGSGDRAQRVNVHGGVFGYKGPEGQN